MKTLNYPRVYVGTYGKYASGSIFGEWVDLADFSDLDDFFNHCKNLHKDETDPEFMFQDIEDDFLGLIDESSINKDIYDIYSELESNDIDIELLGEWVKHTGYSFDDVDKFLESYIGKFDSPGDFAYEMADQLGLLEKNNTWPYNCIDWDQAGRELMYDHMEINGHYFMSI